MQAAQHDGKKRKKTEENLLTYVELAEAFVLFGATPIRLWKKKKMKK